jgi:hypothetical protein
MKVLAGIGRKPKGFFALFKSSLKLILNAFIVFYPRR